MKLALCVLLAVICIGFGYQSVSNQYLPVAGSLIHFTISGPGSKKVHGTLGGLRANIHFDPLFPERSSITATLAASSIYTGNKKRDEHLRKQDFLDAFKYPEIVFTSSSVSSGTSGFLLSGDLVLKDRQHRILIPFTLTEINDTSLFVGTFVLDRCAYGVGKKSPLMGEAVTVNISLPAVKH